VERTTDLVEVYDPRTDKWSTAAPLPEKLDHTAAPYEGKIFIVGGGFNKNGISTNVSFIYNLATIVMLLVGH
jgi:hypothetical protein